MDPLSDVLRAVRLTGAWFFLVEATLALVVGGRRWRRHRPRRPARRAAPGLVSRHHGGPLLGRARRRHRGLARSRRRRRLPPRRRLRAVHGARARGRTARGILARVLPPARRAAAPAPAHRGRRRAGARPRRLRLPRLRHSAVQPHPGRAPAPAPRPPAPARAPAATGWPRCSTSRWPSRATAGGQRLRPPADQRGALRRGRAAPSREPRPGQTGWLAGLRDPVVGRALRLLHQQPARPWTVESLAREAGLSRSALAERFTHFVGQPPMLYLARWRMQVAARLLADGAAKVSAVGVRRRLRLRGRLQPRLQEDGRHPARGLA